MRRFGRNWKLIALLVLSGCGRGGSPPPTPRAVIAWKPIGSWSGRGDKQTETFTSDNGGFRVHWETANETAGGGRLRVVFRSGDSGREIIEAIDARGPGEGTEEVAAERPRWYYLTIESANVDWKVSVDERVETQAADAPHRPQRRIVRQDVAVGRDVEPATVLLRDPPPGRCSTPGAPC